MFSTMETIYSDDPRVIRVTCGWSCTAGDGTVWYLHPLVLSNGATARTTDGGSSAIVGWEMVSADQKQRVEFLECVTPDRALATVLGPPQTQLATAS